MEDPFVLRAFFCHLQSEVGSERFEMSYKITNTALDRTKSFLQRRAPKMQMEPVLAGRRLRIRTSMVISDELFEHNRANLELYRGWGVLDWEKVGGEKPVSIEPPPAPGGGEKPTAPRESPPAETAPAETKPQPKSPPVLVKGKKQ